MEAARLGQLSTVRQLLDGGTATVEDQDEVNCVCVCVCVSVGGYRRVSTQPYSLHACVCTCVSAYLLLQ